MEIGALLKMYRKQLNLTQQQMVGDIITPSFYSKIERGETRISAEDLFQILLYQHIDIVGDP